MIYFGTTSIYPFIYIVLLQLNNIDSYGKRQMSWYDSFYPQVHSRDTQVHSWDPAVTHANFGNIHRTLRYKPEALDTPLWSSDVILGILFSTSQWGIANLSQSPSYKWAELALFLVDPAPTKPQPTRPGNSLAQPIWTQSTKLESKGGATECHATGHVPSA